MAGIRDLVTYGLDSELDNIATILKDEGYVTLGFVNVVLLNNDFGFANGFDHYSWVEHGHGRAAITVDEVLDWFTENQGNYNPKFAVIHFFDVHSPYDPPPPFDTRFSPQGSQGVTTWEVDSLGYLQNLDVVDHLIDLYDGEIAWVDSQIGRLFAELREKGISDNALIIVTSDHGEEFLEHGLWSHGHTLYQELLHVPLIITGPGIPPGVVDSTSCGQFDILPVIAEFTGAAVPDQVEGIDLFIQENPVERVIPSSGVIPGHNRFIDYLDLESMCSVLDESMKGIMNFYTMEKQLFDLKLDPGEYDPMSLDSLLLIELELYWSTPPFADPPVVRDKVIEDNLHDMGYL